MLINYSSEEEKNNPDKNVSCKMFFFFLLTGSTVTCFRAVSTELALHLVVACQDRYSDGEGRGWSDREAQHSTAQPGELAHISVTFIG